ncbi:hypothetical protein IVB12_15300 [Bradyrhizobium sp. 179]|uniref:hypothetical protein n=1 Tax=Bradyrhizobium sp. 179 TaxID=2782648 RepID=UPI001FFAF480|nr:hypothetical protein [Bradyrhizobium sp. 179]MCK1543281.1 hypothetical protein [Bradyrhizobium sp. 179]
MTEALFGLDTGQDDAARIMNRWIKNEWQAVEAALYRGKWFDYRFMNPVQATYLYAHEFVKAYKLAFSVNIDSEQARFVKPLDVERMFVEPEPKQDEPEKAFRKRAASHKMRTVGIWRGRMVADAMGIPYSVYLELAFHWTLRFWQQRHLPRPQQLYSDLVVDRATIGWEERQSAELFYSTLPQYKNGLYQEAMSMMTGDDSLEGSVLHAQNQHHEWLFAQCENRVNGHELLAQLVFHDQVLPLEKVKARLEDHRFEHFLSFANSEPIIQRYS